MAILVFSGAMAASAAVLAEAVWYGSLRGDVMLDKGMDAKFYGGCSRWCIKGSNEVVEELSAVCRFEHRFCTEDAGQAGVIRDIGHWYGGPNASGRVGKVLSYAYSNDAFGLQVDAIMDGKKDSGRAIDQLALGATVNIGDLGRVAFAHVRKEDVKTVCKVAKVAKWASGSTVRKIGQMVRRTPGKSKQLIMVTLSSRKNLPGEWR